MNIELIVKTICLSVKLFLIFLFGALCVRMLSCCKIYKETAMLERQVYKMYIEDREYLKKD